MNSGGKKKTQEENVSEQDTLKQLWRMTCEVKRMHNMRSQYP